MKKPCYSLTKFLILLELLKTNIFFQDKFEFAEFINNLINKKLLNRIFDGILRFIDSL